MISAVLPQYTLVQWVQDTGGCKSAPLMNPEAGDKKPEKHPEFPNACYIAIVLPARSRPRALAVGCIILGQAYHAS
jgi:hypothetical protein